MAERVTTKPLVWKELPYDIDWFFDGGCHGGDAVSDSEETTLFVAFDGKDLYFDDNGDRKPDSIFFQDGQRARRLEPREVIVNHLKLPTNHLWKYEKGGAFSPGDANLNGLLECLGESPSLFEEKDQSALARLVQNVQQQSESVFQKFLKEWLNKVIEAESIPEAIRD